MPPRFSYKTDSPDSKEDADKRPSPTQTAQDLQKQEQQSGYDKDFSGITDPKNMAKDGKSGDLSGGDVKEAEEEGDWNNRVSSSYGGNKSKKGRKLTLANVKAIARKRGALVAILMFFGVSGGALAGFLGPTSMLINAMENITTTNDSTSTSFERRFMKTFGFSTSGDAVCTNTKAECKLGRISNKALSKLEEKGITAIHDPTTTNIGTAAGYPSKNPTGYSIKTDTGIVDVDAKKLPEFLESNPKVAAKVLGRTGAFNLRITSWAGKYITKSFFEPNNIKKDGGLADGENENTTNENRLKTALEKLKAKIPEIDKLGAAETATGKVKTQVTDQLEKSKKGGVVYSSLAASCVAVKAPAYIAAGVAGIQLAQLLPIIEDTILSPASKLKATGVDKSAKFTSADMDLIGTLLTEKTARSSDGKMSSALDSPILLSALGINKGKTAVPKKYAPGYEALTSDLVKGSNNIQASTKSECNALLSPAAMYSAMAVDAAATVASSATVVGGLVKVVGSFVIQEVVADATKEIIGSTAKALITQIAQNDAIPKAQGQDFGDVLGISALSFFSAGGMKHSLPVLKKSQLAGFAVQQQKSQDFQKQMDIASLSPFDTSSQYTFLGSIVHNVSVASISSGSYDSGIFSQIMGYLKTPFLNLSTTASAANYTTESCGYAADYGLDATDDANTPGINAAGLGCMGFTDEQINMSVPDAIHLMSNEKWLDETKEFADNATIDDLLASGYIKAGTPLSDNLADCRNASDGAYLYNSLGCTVSTTTADPTTLTSSCTERYCPGKTDGFGEGTAVKDARSLSAISVFLTSFQSIQSQNGEDEVVAGASASANTDTSTDKKALAQKIVAKNKVKYLDATVKPTIDDIASGKVDADAEPCGININILKIIDTITDSHSITISDINRQCNGSTITSSLGRHVAGNGSAVDIAVIDGVATSGRDANAVNIIGLAMPILTAAAAESKSYSQVGQIGCGTSVTLGVNVRVIKDSCNHVHLDVPAKSDPTLKYSPGW